MSTTCTRCGEDRSYELALGDQSGLCWRPACAKLPAPGTVTRDFPIDLPVCEPERPDESIVDHGARVLTFILQTSCYATLSDLELERAHLASQYAICARGISVPAADRLSDVRHVIAATLTWRKGQPAEPPAIVDGGQLTGKLGTGGPADREPLQPKPRTEPPAAAAVLPPWQPARDRVQF